MVGLYLHLGSPDRPVWAYVADETVAEAAGYQPGQAVMLTCFGASGQGRAVLLNCQSANAKPFIKWGEVQRQVEGWLRRDRQPGFIQDADDGLLRTLFVVYWTGANLPAGSPCIHVPDAAGCDTELPKYLAAMSGREAARYQADYEASREWLGLPAFVPPAAPTDVAQ